MHLPAQSQEHGGNTRRWTITRGELDRAIDGQQPSSRTGICSMCEEEQEEHCQSPTK